MKIYQIGITNNCARKPIPSGVGVCQGCWRYNPIVFYQARSRWQPNFVLLMNGVCQFHYVIKSIKCVKLHSTFYILPAPLKKGVRCRTGHNECPLSTIRVNSESPTTFLRMFKAPFWSALITLPVEERNSPRFTRLPRYSSCLPIGSRARASHFDV